MGVGVVLASPVMQVAFRRIRGKAFKPPVKVLVEAALVVVDKHACRDVHRVYKHYALPDAACFYYLSYLRRDVDKRPAVWSVKGQVLGPRFHGCWPAEGGAGAASFFLPHLLKNRITRMTAIMM